MHDDGVRHPCPSTIEVSAGAVNPDVATGAHAGLVSSLSTNTVGLLALVPKIFGRVSAANAKAMGHRGKRRLVRCLRKRDPAEHLVSLAPPFYMRKNAHVHVLHIARVRSLHSDSPTPSRELARCKHFTSCPAAPSIFHFKRDVV